ncbi:MAG TPA: hypothetical protein VFP20_04315 [Bacteroidales bacterium]|nr:hypothetical protein [Bacteroidales bacterium]
MTRTILRAVIGGIFVGALAFFAPKVLLGLFIFCIIICAFHCCGARHCCGSRRFGSKKMFYLADRIRKMTDEEYEEFKATFGDDCCQNGRHHYGNCCGSDDSCCDTDKSTKQSK